MFLDFCAFINIIKQNLILFLDPNMKNDNNMKNKSEIFKLHIANALDYNTIKKGKH